MEWVLLTVVSRALITQAMLCDAPLVSLVWVAVGRATAMSSTAAVRAARVMPHVGIDVILHDAILLLHGNTITFISSFPLVPIIVIVVIIELVIIIILPVVRGSSLTHCSLP